MAEFVKIYCCGDCINYNWKKHKCNRGAHEEGKPTDHFYRDCPMGLHEESQWVLCSERLPEEDVEVLISYRYKEGEGDTSHVNVDITTYGQMCFGGREVAGEKHWRQPFEYFSSNYEVIAWMPLPEPYKMDGEEQNDD